MLLLPASLVDGSFEATTEGMLTGAGYVRAVKNRFQMHRLLDVRGEQVVFHADFLNDDGAESDMELVVGAGRVRSIYTPAMKLVAHGNFRFHNSLPQVRFPSVDAFIATKAAASLVKKRQRDAFDIFVSLLDAGAREVGERWKLLQEQDELFRRSAQLIAQAFHRGDAVSKVVALVGERDASLVRSTFAEFLEASGTQLEEIAAPK